jgi:hypothetical protein
MRSRLRLRNGAPGASPRHRQRTVVDDAGAMLIALDEHADAVPIAPRRDTFSKRQIFTLRSLTAICKMHREAKTNSPHRPCPYSATTMSPGRRPRRLCLPQHPRTPTPSPLAGRAGEGWTPPPSMTTTLSRTMRWSAFSRAAPHPPAPLSLEGRGAGGER